VRRKTLLCLVIAILALAAWPVHAQEGDLSAGELELLEFVAAAFNNLLAQESYHTYAVMETMMALETEQEGETLDVYMLMDIDMSRQIALKGGEVAAFTAQGTEDIIIGMAGQILNTSIELEMVQLEDDLWVRIKDATDFAADFFPDHWVNLAENPETLEGFEIFDWENLVDVGIDQFTASISEEAVLSIEELESETLNGQKTRVFEINSDPAMATDLLSDVFDPTTIEGLYADLIFDMMFEDATFAWKVWINIEDELPYRITSDATINADLSDLVGFTMKMNMESSDDTSFFDFNEPVEIEPPDIDAGQ
jgi:hypothetical protein